MAGLNDINRPNLRNADGSMSVEEYHRQEKALETRCKQFEGTIFSKIWKDMMKSARSIGGEDRKRSYGPLEDTVVEMVSEHLSESQGIGVWKVLYDNLHSQLEVPAEIRAEREAAAAASAEEKSARNLRPSRTSE
jgi:Rod binding domain-containing protein